MQTGGKSQWWRLDRYIIWSESKCHSRAWASPLSHSQALERWQQRASFLHFAGPEFGRAVSSPPNNSEHDVMRRVPPMQVQLGQRITVNFLTKEITRAYAILVKLQARFEDTANASRTIRFWMGEVRRGWEDLRDEHDSEKPPLDHMDSQILHILTKSSFESAWSIGQTLKISHSVVMHHLHEVRGFKSFHLRWVLHFSIDDLRFKRQ
jgi:hypothetical protein